MYSLCDVYVTCTQMADAERDHADAMEAAMEDDNDAAELSSDGSSSEDEEGEAVSSEVIQQMEEIKEMLSANPYHYDSHLQLISLARSVGDLDAARKAREAVHDVFPLTEALWLEWLRDELPLADLDEALSDIRVLFEKAVDDYIAPGVWLMFAQFAVQKMDKFEEGIAFPRDVFERAITASGLHASKGSLLWDAYREFEMAVLSSLQAMQPEGGPDEELTERIQSQYGLVENIFKRQLAVPLIGMQSTFKEYQEWCDEDVSEDSLPTYTLAARKLKELEKLERNLSADTPPSLDVYREYIAHELKGKDLARISCIYMRALADHCLDVELWREYLKYLDSSLKVRDTVLCAHQQSVRNCPWSVDVWVSYLRAMERLQCPHEEVLAKFEAALSGNFTESRDYVRVWLVYCEYLQRRVSDWTQTDSPDIKEIMDTFKRARGNLKEYFGPSGDQEFVLARFQAQIEAGCRGNIERARQMWNEIIRSHASKAEFQLQYVSLERRYGDESRCRSLWKRAVDSVQDHPDLVFVEYLSFERERGTLDSLVAAEERVEARRAQLKRRAEKEKQKDIDMAALRKQKGRRGKGGEERGAEGEVRTRPSTELRRKRRHHVYFQDDDEEAPDVETAASLTTPTTVEQQSEPAAKKPRVQEVSTMEDVVKPPVNEQGHSPEEPADHAPSDARVASATVFVSNLPFGTKTSEIQSLFVTCGDIVDVRTIRSGPKGKAKKPFAYAYVQFSTEEAVQKALMHDRVSFHGRQVYVSPCSGGDKKQGTETGPVARFPEGKQQETVFVSNLPFSCEEDHVKNVFSKCGEVKQVRMVTFSKGRRKGIAYVEYLDEQSARKAVMELDQFEIDERKINVAISNPPRKGKQSGTDVAMETGPSRREPKRGMAPPSLIPSSVSRKPRINIGASVSRQGKGGGKEEGEGEREKKGLSNDDFKKLFASK